MDQNILIKLLILIFGSVYGFRILKIVIEKLKRIAWNLENTRCDVIFLIFILFLFPFLSSIELWFLFLIYFLLAKVTIFVTDAVFYKKLRQDFVFFVDSVLLHLKMGNSLRASLEKSAKQVPPVSRSTLERIVCDSIFCPQSRSADELESQIEEEIRSWLALSSRVIHRISAFRAQLRMEDSFRRKAEQVIQQIRLQIVLLSIMYMGILFFVVQRFSWGEYLPLYLVSFFLFLLGLLSFYYISRRKIWKI